MDALKSKQAWEGKAGSRFCVLVPSSAQAAVELLPQLCNENANLAEASALICITAYLVDRGVHVVRDVVCVDVHGRHLVKPAAMQKEEDFRCVQAGLKV